MAPSPKRRRLSAESATSPISAPTENAAASATPSKTEKTDATSQRRSLFVRSLPPTTTTESLTEIFSESYPIKHAMAVLDRETKQCKGYGFVTFADAEDAQRAKEEFNGFTVDGRKLRIEVAEPRHRDKETAVAAGAAQAAKERKEKEMADRQPPKLIVRNLPWSVKKPEDLSKLFLSYGKVKYVTLPKGKNGMLAGFGFVTLRGRKNAEKAIEGVNGKEIDGRQLAVDFAVEKEVWQKQNEDAADEDADQDKTDADMEVDSVDGGVGLVEDDDEDEDEDDEEDDEDGDEGMEDEDEDEEDESHQHREEDRSATLFVRNVPFTCSDEDLEDHFTQFGSVRYARIVVDRETERPKGTGFVAFYSADDALECLKGAPRYQAPRPFDKENRGATNGPSILQDENMDPSGRYTMDGRVLQVSQAVDKSQATRFTQEGVAYRNHRDNDKRRLYLLSEGTIPSNSALYAKLSPSEITMREASVKQRKTLIESNPSLHMSLTRLSVRNIPRSIGSKELKELARKAVVGFATEVKEGKRQPLSKEELARGGEEMRQAEKERRAKAKGVVKQAKIVFEGREGSKVNEKTGAGRSRGYGFIEYYTHRSALMGLRWLNGHAVDYETLEKEGKGKKHSKEVIQERKKRLIVEFAIENAQVVQRRREREVKIKERGSGDANEDKETGATERSNFRGPKGKFQKGGKPDGADRKRKRGNDEESTQATESSNPADEKLAKRGRIIQRKRMMRRARKSGGK
ncbi:RNA recognition motif-containing protein [Zalaria obscura]|uniref:RNA recognition motif-containing protein n=1 Tax=Zalaria obscura TaxID=2024903 RepID=A0ACC3S5E2_9PEZI